MIQTPSSFSVAITPSDSTSLTNGPCQAIYIGGTGDINLVTSASGSIAVRFKRVPAGTILPVSAVRVMDTGTTATNLVAMY